MLPRDVLFSLVLCKSALPPEQAVCPVVSLGHSLGDSRPALERVGVNKPWLDSWMGLAKIKENKYGLRLIQR